MIVSETFAFGDSPMHRLDPRIKIVLATAFAFTVALSSNFWALIAALGASLGLIAVSGLGFRSVLKRLILVNGFILFFWLVLPLTVAGEPYIQLGPFTLTREGILLSAQITIKSNAILISLIALLSTSSISTLGHALNRLKVPDKLVLLLLLTFRYIFVLELEYQRLRRAIRMRGFKPGTNLHAYRTYAYVIGMLFVRASARAERVHQAMLCRGFQGKFKSLRTFAIDTSDKLWATVVGIMIAIVGVLEWGRYL